MEKMETIINPSPDIEAIQEHVRTEITKLIPNSRVELIGAMAVPMVGRPEIDLMIISDHIEEDSKVLVTAGYRQGPMVHGISFLKRMEEGIEIAVQVMNSENRMVNVHRNLIRILREDNDLRNRYEDFKRTLSGLSRDEYKRCKSVWIQENLLPLLK